MAFQFKRDRSENLTLILSGDIDLEVTPDIKSQLASQLADAGSLTIDAARVSYLDSSGVSILVIAMQSCKQKQLTLSISQISEEALRVLQLARLDKILPIVEVSGPSDVVDVDVFSEVSANDGEIAAEVQQQDTAPDSDDALIAALASGDMAQTPTDAADMGEADAPSADETAPEQTSEQISEQIIEPASEPAKQPAGEKIAEPAQAAPAPAAAPKPDNGGSGGSGGGGGFTPGTFN